MKCVLEVVSRSDAGSVKTPRSGQRRVASMDKIMGDIMRRKKIDAAASAVRLRERLAAAPPVAQPALLSVARRAPSQPSAGEPPMTDCVTRHTDSITSTSGDSHVTYCTPDSST